MTALGLLGLRPLHLARDRYNSDSDLYQAVHAAADSETPVIAGPLNLAETLVGASKRLILLSWGFDLQEAPLDLDLSSFSAVIVDSMANQRIARTARAQHILHIPWGIDIQALDENAKVADLSEYGINPHERVVLSLRAHEPRYRIGDIIHAFAQHPIDARLVIGNSGSLTPEVRRQADRLGVGVTFLPPVEEREVSALLRRASAYVTASEVDGTSVTLLQAMACKVPVVASANAGNADWIDDGVTGFLFPVADIGTLAKKIDRSLGSNPEILEAARSRVMESADWRRNIHALTPLFERRS